MTLRKVENSIGMEIEICIGVLKNPMSNLQNKKNDTDKI